MNLLKSISKKMWIIITSTVASAAVLVTVTAFVVTNQIESRDLMPVLLEAKESLEFPESTKANLTFDDRITIGEYEVDISYASTKPNRMDNLGNIIDLPSQQEAYDDVIIVVTLSIGEASYTYPVEIRIYGESKPVVINVYDFEEKVMTITKKEGDTLLLSELIAPKKDGYSFVGFYLDPLHTESFGQSQVLEEDLNIYAKYEALQTLIIYGFDEVLYSENYALNMMIDLNEIELKTFEGYTFKHFTSLDNEVISNTSIALSDDVIIIAVYEKNQYEITFEMDSVFLDGLNNVQNAFLYQEVVVLPTLDSNTHRIEGFYLDEAYTIPFSNLSSQLEANLIIYINIVQDIFKVSYVEQLESSITTLREINYKTGENISLTSILKEDHIFLAWSIDDEIIDSNTFEMPSEDIILEAVYISESDIIEVLNLNESASTNLTFVSSININEFVFNIKYVSNFQEDMSNAGVILRRPTTIEGNKNVSFTLTISYKDQSFDYLYEVEILPITSEVEVTFIFLNGQTELETFELGDTLVLIDEIAYEDYEFDGYFLDPSFQNEVQETLIVNQDLNIYAKYTLLRTLTIVNVDGTITELSYRDGTTLDLATLTYTMPERYTHLGFSNQPNSERIEAPIILVSDRIIFPLYDLLPISTEVEVTFIYLNGQTELETFELGDTLVLIDEIAYEDYEFDGYYIDPNFDTEASASVILNQDMNIYAKYTLLRTLTIVNVDGTITNINYKDQSVVTTDLIDYTLPEGYILEGYLKINDLLPLEETFIINSNMIIFPVYDLEVYTLTFVVEEGIFDEIDVNDTVEFTAENQPENLYFDNGIYQTTGLYLDEDLTIPFDEEVKYLEDLTVYIDYEQYQVIVSLNIDQDVEYYNDQVFFVSLNGTIDSLAEPFKYGYSFMGWSIENSDEIIEDLSTLEVNQDLTLLPIFEEVQNINYEFVLNNGESNVIEVFEFNEIIQYPSVEKEGHTFVGWFEEDNSNNFYQPERIFEIESKTLYAKWTVNTYELLILDDGVVLEQTIYTYGTELDIELLDGEKEGYRFTGFSRDIPDTMPAENVLIEYEYQQILNLTYAAEDSFFPNQALQFLNDENSNFASLFLTDGILLGFGSNFSGSFAVNDLTLNTFDIEDDFFFYNISNNLDLNIDESIVKINSLYGYVYAATNQNRILRWGIDETSEYVDVEVIDVLEHDVKLLLQGFDEIGIVTVEDEFFIYPYDEDIVIDLTTDYRLYKDEFVFSNDISSSFYFEYISIHDGYLVGYSNSHVYFVNFLEEGFSKIPLDAFFNQIFFDQDIDAKNLLYVGIPFSLDYPPIFLLDTMLLYVDEDEKLKTQIVDLDLQYGEVIEEFFVEFLPFDNDQFYIGLYTNYNRILVPRRTVEVVDSVEIITLTYQDITDIVLFEGEFVVDVINQVLITNTNMMLNPLEYSYGMYIKEFSEWDEGEILNFQSYTRIDVSTFIDEGIILFDSMNYEIFTNLNNYQGIYSSIRDITFTYQNPYFEISDIAFDKKVTMTAEEILNYVPFTPENYMFDGWYIDENLEIEATLDNIIENTFLYPKFIQTHYEVQYILYDILEDVMFVDIFDGEYEEGAITITYEMDEIPSFPSLSLFGTFEDYMLSGEAFEYDIETEKIDFDTEPEYYFDDALNKNSTIFLTLVPKVIDVEVIYPDDTSDVLSVAWGIYVYDLEFQVGFNLPSGLSVEGYYFDENYEVRMPSDFKLVDTYIFYVAFEEESYAIRYVIEVPSPETIVFEFAEGELSLIQSIDGEIFIRRQDVFSFLASSSIIPGNFNEYLTYSDYVNVTSYFDLNEGELIQDIYPLQVESNIYLFGDNISFLRVFYYAIVTDQNRVFISGTQPYEEIEFNMVLVDSFVDNDVMGVAYAYGAFNELYILLDDGSIQIYEMYYDSDVQTYQFQLVIDVQTDVIVTEVFAFLVVETQLILLTEKNFMIFNLQSQLGIYEEVVFTDDSFIGIEENYYDVDSTGFTIMIMSEKGKVLTYNKNQNLGKINQNQIPLQQGELLVHMGNFFYDDWFVTIAISDRNQLYAPQIFETFDLSGIVNYEDIVVVDTYIVLEDGTYVGIVQEMNEQLELEYITEVYTTDLNGLLIESFYFEGFVKLNDGSYYSLGDEETITFLAYRFLDLEETIYKESNKPTLNTSIEPDDFFGWTIDMTDFTTNENATLITELPDESTLIYALINE